MKAINIVTGTGNRVAIEAGPKGKKISHESLPIIDLLDFNIDGYMSNKHLDYLVKMILDAASKYGFFYIVNHSVKIDLINNAFKSSKLFFERDDDYKINFFDPLLAHRRGYNPPLVNTNPRGNKEISESFYIGSEPQCGITDFHPEYITNIWPENNSSFIYNISSYFSAIEHLSKSLFQLFSLALGLSSDYFRNYTKNPGALLRLIHYRSENLNEYSDQTLGARPHADHNWFTILAQDSVEALQVLDNNGSWICVSPIPGSFVINIGDQLSIFSDKLFKSAVHRVVNISDTDRYSLAYFSSIDHGKVIQPISYKETPLTKKNNLSSGDYLIKRRKETYL